MNSAPCGDGEACSDAGSPEHVARVAKSLELCQRGSPIGRVKSSKSIMSPKHCRLNSDCTKLNYYGAGRRGCLAWAKEKEKNIDVTEIIEVRSGWNSDNFNKAQLKPGFADKCPENNCFSVIFRHPQYFQKSLDLFAPTEIECQSWTLTLSHLVEQRRKQQHKFDSSAWLTAAFDKADTNKDGVLTLQELCRLLHGVLQLEISKEYVTQVFERARRSSPREDNDDMLMPIKLKMGQPGLDRQGFVQFFNLLTHRPALAAIVKQFSTLDDGDVLSADDLHQFFHVEQSIDKSVAECEKLIKTFEPNEALSCQNRISVNGFRRLLLSDEHAGLMTLDSLRTPHDMTRPMNEYWVNSSHNTYLTGGQVRGGASVEGYVNAMQQGARLVELDVWDGSDGEPCIYHGHTLVKPITLYDTCECIRDYAFKYSPFPLLLSIENHCSVEQQRKMAQIFKSVFGDKLYVRAADAEGKETMPSPQDLRNRIVLKAGMLPSAVDESDNGYGEMSCEEESDAEELATTPRTCSTRLTINQSPQSSRSGSPTPTRKRSTASLIKKAKSKQKLARELSDLVGIPAQKLHDLKADLESNSVDSMCSLAESKADKLLESQPLSLMVYADRHLVKVYPHALRTDSSNVMPVPLWMRGLQCVTLNMQTCDEAMDLNSALFRQNNRWGYVLKPASLRGIHENSAANLYDGRPTLRLIITIISAQCLPKPDTTQDNDVLDPYVTVETYGLSVDCKKERTNWIHDNGFNPEWTETFVFNIAHPQVAFVRFCVKDHDTTGTNDFVGEYSVPVLSIRPGYSHIHLRTGFRHIVDPAANVFVHVKMIDL